MLTTDESLEQIRIAGRAAASIRANAELLASANAAVISPNAAQAILATILQSRQLAAQEKLRAEGYRRALLPHLEAGAISQEDAVTAFAGHIQGVQYTERLFVDIIANFGRSRSSLAARTDVVDAARGNFDKLVYDLARLEAICEIASVGIRAHCRTVSTQMQAAQLAPTMQALVNRGALIGNMSRWLEQALELYASQLASLTP